MPKPSASARKGGEGRAPPAPRQAPRGDRNPAKARSPRRAKRSIRRAEERNGGARPLEAAAGIGAGEDAERRARRPGKTATADRQLGASRGKYVYCVIEAPDALRFGPIGIGATPSDVYTVHFKNLAAVVSDAPLEVLDSTRENVLAHERVNETVMREHTVIPMSFGTIFKTREDIVELLRSAAEAFGDVLNKMQNKLEFGLKVLWDRDQAIREVEHEDEDISRLKKEISSQKGPTYFARMQYGRLVDAALQSRSERYVAEILDELRDVSVASRVNKPIGDKMIMNAAFLISRDQESAFDAKVKSIASRFDKMTFKYTGPWPPYNFVNIRLKLERACRVLPKLALSIYSNQRMFILDSMLIGSLRFVLDKIVAAAEAESRGRLIAPRAAARSADAPRARRDRRERVRRYRARRAGADSRDQRQSARRDLDVAERQDQRRRHRYLRRSGRAPSRRAGLATRHA